MKRTRTSAALRGRKPRGQGHERRAEILAAAKQLFVSEGYETVTTRKLAERAGMSQTGLYVYFKTKEEILTALSQETFGMLSERLDAVAKSGPASMRILHRMGDAYVRFGVENPDEYQLAFLVRHTVSVQPKDLSMPRAQQPLGMQAFLILYEQCVRLHEAGLLAVDAMQAAQLAWLSLHGLVAALIALPHFPWLKRDELIEAMLDMIIRGIGAAPKARSRGK